MNSTEAQITKIVRRNVANRKPGDRGTASLLQEIGSETTLTVGLETGTGTWLAHLHDDEGFVVVVPQGSIVGRTESVSERGPLAVIVQI